MTGDFASDSRAERALLAMARRGDLEALRGMLHRYSSVLWAACALASQNEPEASERFADAWNHILRSLGTARRSPDLAGLLLSVCGARLAESLPPDAVRRAVNSAAQMAARGEALEAPSGAMRAIEESLANYGERLAQETVDRRARRRERAILPGGLALALLVGLLVAHHAAMRPTAADIAARTLRHEVVAGDMVTRFRDCVSPPFVVTDREPAEARQYEQIGLVLEELSNAPASLRSAQLADLRQRVEALGLDDFALEQADRAPGDARQDLLRIALVLEEIANL